jgi:putative endonuclease
MPAWFYILRLRSQHLYSGSTRSLEKRIKEHFDGKGGRTTNIDRPVAFVYSEEHPTYKNAFRREQQVKRWSRAKKEALIAGKLDQLKRLAKKKTR